MPLSFAASLGSTITLIGAPAFLIMNSLLAQAGRPRLGIFSIAPIGLSLSLMGTLFMLLFGRFLLPTHTEGDEVLNRFRLEDYLKELTILPDSPFLGQTLVEVEAGARYQLKVVGWLRHGRRLRPPFGGRPVRAGDVLLDTGVAHLYQEGARRRITASDQARRRGHETGRRQRGDRRLAGAGRGGSRLRSCGPYRRRN
jgi:di/tricarboxylate transporter